VATEQLFVSIVLILVAARVLGEIFQRFKQPPLVGELLAGVIIGPSILELVNPGPDLQVLSNLAVFFLMFLALIAVAMVTKITAGYAGAKIAGFDQELSLAIGFLLNGRE